MELTELDMPPGATVIHEPHGFVHLNTHNGDDLTVVNAARVSFAKQSEWEIVDADGEPVDGPFKVGPDPDNPYKQQLSQGDEGVLRFLLFNKHGTPFEHTYFQFLIRAPIFVFREWHRHRIGISINEESARYVEMRPDFYVPDLEHCRTQTDKPGRYKFEQMDEREAEVAQQMMRTAYEDSYVMYQALMAKGLAKEVARTVLPVGLYSTMVWTCNARSLMSFLALRNAPTALAEIRDYAAALEDIFEKIMPTTHKYFVENGRVAP